jgi:DNA-binding transcriptional LysR family regulator
MIAITMDLHQLRTFIAVAAAGHVTRAAEKLHLSQPTVSGHIKALEEELGVSLFDRAAGGVSLTHSGKLLLQDAEKVIAASQRLRDHARALSGNLDARLRIGTILDPDYLRLGELIAVMQERYPMLDTELHQAISGLGVERVKSGELDAAFVLGDDGDPALRILPLEPQLYVVVIPRSWHASIDTWEQLAARPWVLTPSKGRVNRMAHEMLGSRHLAPASVTEADQESMIRSLVAAGVGISMMREDLAQEASKAGEIVVWPQGQARTVLSLVYAAEREQSPEIQAFLRAVEDVWHKGVAGTGVVRGPQRQRDRREAP